MHFDVANHFLKEFAKELIDFSLSIVESLHCGVTWEETYVEVLN